MAAEKIGRTILLLKAGREDEIDLAFATMSQKWVGGLLVAADPFFNAQREQIVLWTVRYGLPAAYEQREFVLAGGLMSYGTSITSAYRQMGIYAGRILKGDKPADLPVERTTKFELVINLKTAKALGLQVPLQVQQRADEMIE